MTEAERKVVLKSLKRNADKALAAFWESMADQIQWAPSTPEQVQEDEREQAKAFQEWLNKPRHCVVGPNGVRWV